MSRSKAAVLRHQASHSPALVSESREEARTARRAEGAPLKDVPTQLTD
jgi:hypothetical protein